jgi:hypothetical protein
MWELDFGAVFASLSAAQYDVLNAALDTFRSGFLDPFNAPSSDYAVASDPDGEPTVHYLSRACQSTFCFQLLS